MAPHLSETIVAAPQTLILRNSVNAERGRGRVPSVSAKVGNATTMPDAKTPSAGNARGDGAIGGRGDSALGHSGTPFQRPLGGGF
jgi:hypothetical protein